MAARLQHDGRDQVTFIGTPDGLEARLVPEAGIDFVSVPARGFDRARLWTAVTAVLTALGSVIRAVRLVHRFKPQVVIGFGGYVSVPLGLAALVTRTPLVLAEQNSVPGLANRIMSRWARAVAVTYPASSDYLAHPERGVHTGNPVRASVLAADRTAGRRMLGLPDDAVVVLVFGGSRGARHINSSMVSLWSSVSDILGLEVIHVAGRSEAAAVRERIAAADVDTARYHVLDYIEDMGAAMAAADLIIGRAGATSIAEITAIGRAAILIPYPFATDDHQTLNARALEGAAVTISDSELDEPVFARTVRRLLEDETERVRMAKASRACGMPDAVEQLAALVRASAKA